MDNKLRELERLLQSDPSEENAMRYFYACLRMGKVRFRAFPTPKVGIHVRRDGWNGPYYVANTNVSPETRCKHRHTKKSNAVKCARRHAHRHMLETPDAKIIAHYVRTGGN